MAHSCPQDGAALAPDTGYGQACRRCDAVLLRDETLESRHPGAPALLEVETDERNPAFAAGLECPGCRRMLAPWRIRGTGSHAFRCLPCGWSWLSKRALLAFQQQVQRRAAADAYRSLPEAERRELARGIAGAGGASRPALSPTHALLAIWGCRWFPGSSARARRSSPGAWRARWSSASWRSGWLPAVSTGRCSGSPTAATTPASGRRFGRSSSTPDSCILRATSISSWSSATAWSSGWAGRRCWPPSPAPAR